MATRKKSRHALAPVIREVSVLFAHGELFVERPGSHIMKLVASPAEAIAVIGTDNRQIAKRQGRPVVARVSWQGLPTFVDTKIGGAS